VLLVGHSTGARAAVRPPPSTRDSAGLLTALAKTLWRERRWFRRGHSSVAAGTGAGVHSVVQDK
jgi:hypothetical protein